MSARIPAHAWPRTWSRARRRGVAAMEFAAVAPALVVVFLGSFQLLDAATVYRKLTDTTVQLANVTSQYTTMSLTDVNTVLGATSTIMSPYATTVMSIVLSEVTTDNNGNATVTWSQAFQGTPLAKGSGVTMPTGFNSPNTSYIVVQSTYAYTPSVGASIIGSIPMSKQVVMLPRASSSIPFTG
jgi:Flp pilus assembly protein TadG